jgi:isoleucyl-tRNA synthetase
LHVLSTGIFDQPAFENALTTGTILAEDGAKMSKSKKNYPDPMELINQYGVDSMRLYLMSSTVMKGENLRFREKDVSDIRRKVFVLWWNMLRFYKEYGSFDHAVTQLPEIGATGESGTDEASASSDAHLMDRWMVSRLVEVTREVTEDLADYDVVSSSRKLMEFVNQISTWYLRLSRDRLRSDDNAAVSHVLGAALYRTAILMAPFAPYFSELVHHALVDDETSIHHQDWPEWQSEQALYDEQLEKDMAVIEGVIEAGRAVRAQESIKLRQPLQSITVTADAPIEHQSLLGLVEQELNVKEVIWDVDVERKEAAVEYDLDITPALKTEFEARELVRDIQRARRKAGTDFDAMVIIEAPAWPEEWEDYIKERAQVSELRVGDEVRVVEEV